jgi:hypothetical protein
MALKMSRMRLDDTDVLTLVSRVRETAYGAVLAVVLWIAFVGHVLTRYVGPIIQAGVRAIATTLDQLHGDRNLFQNPAGGGTHG